MQVSVTFRNMESKEILREYVQEKISKLKKYFDYPLEANAVLIVEKHRHIAEVTLVANRLTINAQEETEDMFSAIDRVLDKLERQILKHKEKIKRHKASAPSRESFRREEAAEPISSDEVPEPTMIKSKKIRAKLMSVEEAALQLDLLENDFLIFTNANSKNLNVIYRLKDGHYGLIEPQVA